MNLPHFRMSAGLSFSLMLAVSATFVYPNPTALAEHSEPSVTRAPSAHADLNALPAELIPAVATTLAMHSPETWRARTMPQHGAIFNNPAQHLTASFNQDGARLQFGGAQTAQLNMQLLAMRSGKTTYPVTPVKLSEKNNRIELAHDYALTEWYVNSPLGVEQGFTIAAPPKPNDATPALTLVFKLGGNLKPVLASNSIEFQNPKSQPVLHYGKLLAYDAHQRALPARMLLAGSKLELEIDTRSANYPITIDPLFASVTSFSDPPAAADDYFGFAVALSASGNIALIGAPGTTVSGNSLVGTAYLFARINGTWSGTPVHTFNDPPGVASDEFGIAVALSSDGSSALISAAGTTVSGNHGVGAVYIYTQSGGNWPSTPTHAFSDPVGAAGDNFGSGMALSADASTAVISSPLTAVSGNLSEGVVYAYTKSGGTWSATPSHTFNDPAGAAGDEFGLGLALSADGSSTLMSAPFTKVSGVNAVGVAYVYTQSNGAWPTTPTHSFNDPPGVAGDEFGYTLSLSGDGSSALIGAPFTTVSGNSSVGAAYIFTLSNGAWPSGPTHTFSDPVGAANDVFGDGPALSADGSIAFIGAPGTTVAGNASVGVTYVYMLTAGTWSATPVTLNDPTPATQDIFGVRTTLSADGSSALISAFGTPVAGKTIVGAAFVISSTADLSLALVSNPTSVIAGQSVNYLFTVTNNDSQVIASDVTVTDTLPSGTSYVSADTAGGTCNNSNGTVTCTLSSLAPGATWKPGITVTPGSAGNLNDTATVSANQPDPNTANNTANVATSVTAPPAPPPSSGGGGGAFGFLSLLLLAPLVRLRKRKV